jgi:hypothetical protein
MDARNLASISARAAHRRTHAAAGLLAVMIAWALWRGYGALLWGGHVH